MMTFNQSSISLPSRLSLWLGVGLVSFGFFKHQPGMTTIGAILIAIGVLLWALYKQPAKKSSKNDPLKKKSKVKQFLSRALRKFGLEREPPVDINTKVRQSIKEGAAALELIKKASNKTNLPK